jgi:hydroxyacylglutathione hydrolase
MPALKVAILPVTPFAQNCSILVAEATGRAAIVDPGGEVARIRAAIDELKVTPEKILLTHGHIDHAGGAAELAEALSIPTEGPHGADRFLLDRLAESGARFGMADARPVTPGRWLKQGDTIEFGGLTLDVLQVPGHTPGHVVFVHAPSKLAIVGDTLFAGAVGRTDMPYGDHAELIRGIKMKLLPLGDEFAILPGHGRASTLGRERQSNPFLQG